MTTRIGIDVGGTRLKVGRVVDGIIVDRAAADTPHDFDAMVARLAELVKDLLARSAPSSSDDLRIGAGVPGVFDLDRSMVLATPNLTFLNLKPLRHQLEQATGGKVRLENDASVAAWAEALHGRGRDQPNFLLATLGTGIGGGLVLNHKLWGGHSGMAGEFGHLSAAAAFPSEQLIECGCGAIGCNETFASASRMELRGQERCGVSDLPKLAAMARNGHEQALSVFTDAGTALGECFAQVVLLLDLRVLLIGGGASPVLDLLREPLLDRLEFRCDSRPRESYLIETAELGNDAGILGAASLN
jgi:glucokinase